MVSSKLPTITNIMQKLLWVLQTVAKLTEGQGAAAPPGRSFRSFWAPCHHIVNFIK